MNGAVLVAAVAALAVLPGMAPPAAGQAMGEFSDVLFVNATAAVAQVGLDRSAPHALASGSAGTPIRLRAGPHTAQVWAFGRVRAERIQVDGGCTSVWLLTDDSTSLVRQFAECPASRVNQPDKASLRLINAAPNATALAVTTFAAGATDGGAATSFVGPFGASGRVAVAAGRDRLAVTLRDRPGVVTSLDATLVASNGYSAVMAGGGEQPVQFFVIKDAGTEAPAPPPPSVPINTGLPAGGPTRSHAEELAVLAMLLIAILAAAGFLGRSQQARRAAAAAVLLVSMSACSPHPDDGAAISKPSREAPAASPSGPSTTAVPTPVAAAPTITEPDAPVRTGSPTQIEFRGVRAPIVKVAKADMARLPAVLPLDRVGWVTGTDPPGQGTTMLVGHSTFTGRGVFQHIGDLKPGDRVKVWLSTGRTVTYTVEQTVDVAKDAVPANWLYAPTTVPLLLLVSCTGPPSPTTGLHTENEIVIASGSTP